MINHNNPLLRNGHDLAFGQECKGTNIRTLEAMPKLWSKNLDMKSTKLRNLTSYCPQGHTNQSASNLSLCLYFVWPLFSL